VTPDNVLSAWVRPARVPKNSRGQRPRTAAPGQALAWHGENTRRSATSESRPVYFPALDGIRAIAVAAVVAYHLQVPGLGGGLLG